MQRVLLTGATGFLGTSILKYFSNRFGFEFLVLVRKYEPRLSSFHQITYQNFHLVPDIHKIDVIIHCAGLAHTTLSCDVNSKRKYVTANIKLTRDLVNFSKFASIKRFIFISTINVHTFDEDVISEKTKLRGTDLYSASKIKCERIIKNTLANSKTSSIILRPSVMYSTDCRCTKGNIGRLTNLMYRYGFLVLPSNSGTQNYTSTENVCSFLDHLLLRADIKNQDFIITDEAPISLKVLILRLSKGIKSKVLILTVPKLFFKILLTAVGLRSQLGKIDRDLHTSVAKAKSFGWTPNN